MTTLFAERLLRDVSSRIEDGNPREEAQAKAVLP